MIVNENLVEEQLTPEEPKPRWRELVLYLAVGFGLYFLASLPLVFLVGNDLSDISLGVTVLIGILNAVCLIGTVYLTGVRRGKISWVSIGFVPPKMEMQWLIIAIVVSLVLIPLRSVVGAAVEYLVHGGLDSLEMRGELLFAGAEPNILNFLVSFMIIAVLVPISEELYFRGLLYRWFQLRFRFWPAVIFSAAIFGLAHYDSLAVVVSSFVMGVVNAIAMERTRSIWVPILMHAVTNGVAVILIYSVLFLEQYFGPLL
jgi:membrane protease YdiL (CAAX protease family)